MNRRRELRREQYIWDLEKAGEIFIHEIQASIWISTAGIRRVFLAMALHFGENAAT
jgi:hypothetical protein